MKTKELIVTNSLSLCLSYSTKVIPMYCMVTIVHYQILYTTTLHNVHVSTILCRRGGVKANWCNLRVERVLGPGLLLASLEVGEGGECQHVVQGAGEAVEESFCVRLRTGLPGGARRHDPILPNLVEEPVAMVDHGGHGPEHCGVPNQTGGQNKVPTASTRDKWRISEQLRDRKSLLFGNQAQAQQVSVKTLSLLGLCHEFVVFVGRFQQCCPLSLCLQT